MIRNENLGSIMGAPVMGPDDDRIGTVGQIFVDPVTGSPNWVTVHTGLFGRHETFVPLDDATWDRE
ncbi:MAG TPA: PRC-barrel domain-containing protein, partial [Homoserinimonas sp.]|nr:PRC-barrel domain-containing protein [Homoserinimonas sp.]